MSAKLTERQKTILDALVREYVASAEPVASAELVRKYRLPFSPATVRSEFLALNKAGYIYQPHTSAGRVPTDRGYRLFINERMAGPRDGDYVSNSEESALHKLKTLHDPASFARQASRMLARMTHSFVLAGFPDEELFYKAGIREVMAEPEFADAGLLHEFGILMDILEDELVSHFDMTALAAGPRVFIGGENPILEARPYGMVLLASATPFDKESVFALVGPKRMDYRHDIAILRHVRELLSG